MSTDVGILLVVHCAMYFGAVGWILASRVSRQRERDARKNAKLQRRAEERQTLLLDFANEVELRQKLDLALRLSSRDELSPEIAAEIRANLLEYAEKLPTYDKIWERIERINRSLGETVNRIDALPVGSSQPPPAN